ncbi:response regulator [Faucicola atlantae]|uniref:response regulator n=1 Tax=Faucicola atlantae TaxID=34059 RepID=UPI0025AFB934|nr:response regulator [Moraxella atlantae]
MDKSEHIEPKRAAQYDAIVRKPIFLNVLISEIKQLCRTDDDIVISTNKQPDLPPQVAFKAFLQQWQNQQSSGVSTSNQTQNASHIDKPMLFRSKTILVAEDNVLNQKIIEKHLAILGYPSIIATNGEEAIEQLNAKRNQIGLILMDCRMPILDGLEAQPFDPCPTRQYPHHCTDRQ